MGERRMSGLTWARNQFDNQALSLKDLSDSFLKLKTQLRHVRPLKAVRISRLTLLIIPLAYRQGTDPISTFYGVPIEIDDSLGLFQYIPVYAGVTCWLCGGSSTETCQCHNHAEDQKAATCNMVCNA